MATQKDIKKAKEETIEEIKNRLHQNPNIGVHEFVACMLKEKGISVDSNNPSEIQEKVKSLKGPDKKYVVKALGEYRKEYDESIKTLELGLHRDITRLPRKAVSTIIKGASVGTGIAGVVNTIAPGLFSTGLGYLAGAGVNLAPLVKLGLVSSGIFAPPALSKWAILAVGAIAGGIVCPSGKVVVTGVKKLAKELGNKLKHKHSDIEI